MAKHLVHYYNPKTGEYLNSSLDAGEDDRGRIAVPKDSTTIPPPGFSPDGTIISTPNSASIYNSKTMSWDIVDDYRDITFYNKETGEEVHLPLGVAPDDSLIDPSQDSEDDQDSESNETSEVESEVTN
jgi:hypothetical protein